MTRIRRAPPGPRAQSILGHIASFRRNPLGFLADAFQEYGDVVKLRMGHKPVVLLRHPDHIQHVLVDHRSNYHKQHGLRVVLGDGLNTSSGESWRRQRRLLQPMFRAHALESLFPVISDVVATSMKDWPSATGSHIDVHGRMMRIALDMVGTALFGRDVEPASDAIYTAANVVVPEMGRRVLRPVSLPLWIPTPGNIRLSRALKTMDKRVYDVIAARRRQHARLPDILERLLLAHQHDGSEPMTDRAVRDQLVTLLVGGHENSGNVLAWMCYLMGTHQPLQDMLHEICGNTTGDSMESNTQPMVRMTVSETMRLYPPGWIRRVAHERDQIGRYDIDAGTLVVISPYFTHRHPEFWPEPERFVPERFAAGVAAHHPCAYIPFGAGPRKCIGLHLAMLEAQSVLSSLARSYRITRTDALPVDIRAVPTISPADGLKLAVATR